MTRSNSSPLPGSIRRVLDRYRRRWRGVNFQRGLFLTLALVAAAVGLAVAADRLLRLVPAARIVALVSIAVLFLATLTRWVIWPVIRRITDRDAAIRVGRHFPTMQEDLVSAVELSKDSEAGSDAMSHGLVISVLERIAGRAQGKVDPRRAVSLRPMLLTGLIMLVVAGVFAAAYAIRPDSINNALARLFQPGQQIPYFSYTKMDVSPGNRVIRRGDTAEVLVSLYGTVPASARLDATSGSTPVRATLACTDSRAEWKSGALFDDFTYRVTAGDAMSDWYRIRVVAPPSLHGKSAIVTDPAYADGDINIRADVQGTLELIKGQTLVLVGEPLARGTDAEFGCMGTLACGADQYPLTADAKGLLRSPLLAPEKSGEYVAMLTDGFGLQSRTPDSTFVKVRDDAVPQVVISEPARDLLLLPGEEAVVSIEAHDEFGMKGLVLAQRKVTGRDPKADTPPEPETGAWNRKVVKEGGRRARDLKDKVRLDIAGLGLQPGDCLEYQAEAADYAGIDEVQRRGASPLWRVTILSEAAHMEMIENKLRELQAELRQRAAEQRAEAAKVEAVEAKAAKEPVTGEAQEAKDRESTVRSATQDTAQKFAALLPDLARNPTTPVESMAELSRLTDAVKSVASGQMSKAEKSLGEAAQSKAGEQEPGLKKAEESEKSAAQKLEDLAGATERLARNNALNKLAGDAERLAARQKDLKQTTEGMAPKTAGKSPKDLSKEETGDLDRLADAEKSIEKGIQDLAKSLEQAAASLGYSSPSAAESAQQAGEKLQQNKTAEQAKSLAGEMQKNTLFQSLPAHDKIAEQLSEVAKQLKANQDKNKDDSSPMEQVIKEIEQFAQQQREINGDTEGQMKKPDPKVSPEKHGDRQANLGRDVSEEAAALKELADEIEDFDTKTAEAMRNAAGEMKEGASDLHASKMPEGLEHGKKALAYLEEAKKDAAEDPGGGGGGGAGQKQDMKAMLQLLKTIAAQKKINRETANAAEERITDTEAFNRRMNDLAGRQSGARQDAKKLEEMAGEDPAAEQIALAGHKMDSSRLALAGGDPGPETRKVQVQILALLEQFLQSRKPPKGGGGSGSGMSLAQMMQMMMMEGPGQQPGGYTGGENAPLSPANASRDDDWHRVRGRFDDHLSEGSQENIPVQFRDVLNSYFDRLRKEPPR